MKKVALVIMILFAENSYAEDFMGADWGMTKREVYDELRVLMPLMNATNFVNDTNRLSYEFYRRPCDYLATYLFSSEGFLVEGNTLGSASTPLETIYQFYIQARTNKGRLVKSYNMIENVVSYQGATIHLWESEASWIVGVLYPEDELGNRLFQFLYTRKNNYSEQQMVDFFEHKKIDLTSEN